MNFLHRIGPAEPCRYRFCLKQERRLTLWFDGDVLVRAVTDVPETAPAVPPANAAASNATAPDAAAPDPAATGAGASAQGAQSASDQR